MDDLEFCPIPQIPHDGIAVTYKFPVCAKRTQARTELREDVVVACASDFHSYSLVVQTVASGRLLLGWLPSFVLVNVPLASDNLLSFACPSWVPVDVDAKTLPH